ncbi:MAG TPA: prepilin-type N-terminal cleavage/methylation domain-containing protein, partial [Myxococcota bacterium]|nr:prepilin-type N-terminal cleavage/methylation domain-containing protein [Myxococcota bacterium]
MRRGFTLVEVLIALGLLATIATMAFMAIASSVQAQQVLEQEDATNQAARVAMRTLYRDISMA